jgi:hypothetical protein
MSGHDIDRRYLAGGRVRPKQPAGDLHLGHALGGSSRDRGGPGEPGMQLPPRAPGQQTGEAVEFTRVRNCSFHQTGLGQRVEQAGERIGAVTGVLGGIEQAKRLIQEGDRGVRGSLGEGSAGCLSKQPPGLTAVTHLEVQCGRHLAPLSGQPGVSRRYRRHSLPGEPLALPRRQQGEKRLAEERMLERVPVRRLVIRRDELGGDVGVQQAQQFKLPYPRRGLDDSDREAAAEYGGN